MKPYHSMNSMINKLKGSTANLPYKRKKMKVSHESSLVVSAIEMEIDSDNESSPVVFPNTIDTNNMLVPPPPLPDPIDVPNPPPEPPPCTLTASELATESMETHEAVENNSTNDSNILEDVRISETYFTSLSK